ncbi:MAG: substrate-binding domain-containing protein [Aureliella sp.]
MKNATIQDIAREANVSKSTVSRVLNGTTPVHPDKRKAVEEAFARLGFRPNAFAKSLASGRSMSIGVLTQIVGSPFYDTISRGIISGLRETDYFPIFVDGQWESATEIDGIRNLLDRRVDGLILMSTAESDTELVELLGDVPSVIVGRNAPSQDLNSIYIDNLDGGYRATKHLVQFGHTRIAIVRGPHHHFDANARVEGYEKALTEAGIPVDPDLVIEGDFTSESGVAAVERLFARGADFSAIFASNDMMAFGIRLALHRRQLNVPDDISLVGFDDQSNAAFMTPPLTTVRQPALEMGVLAAESILSLIQGKPFSAQPLTAELQSRESVGMLRNSGS